MCKKDGHCKNLFFGVGVLLCSFVFWSIYCSFYFSVLKAFCFLFLRAMLQIFCSRI